MKINTAISNAVVSLFEESFLKQPLDAQIAACDRYELAPLFHVLLPSHQPILEAGCGSGRWCAWFRKQGWQTTGIDWSETLCQRARETIPYVTFISGDMQRTDFPDDAFGAVVSLGAVEHVPEGPLAALEEFYRILRPGGAAIVTVPHGGLLRRTIRQVATPVLRNIKTLCFRKTTGKKDACGCSLRHARKKTNRAWAPQFICIDKGWDFFEYEFNRHQMRAFIKAAGFQLEQEFACFHDEGILHNFGRIAARWDQASLSVHLNFLGKLLQRILPVHANGHMLCFVLRKA